jgi:hypothetical protein
VVAPTVTLGQRPDEIQIGNESESFVPNLPYRFTNGMHGPFPRHAVSNSSSSFLFEILKCKNYANFISILNFLISHIYRKDNFGF